MGLIDILNGMQNGPRGPSQSSSTGKVGGMSPIMMAMLGLLAYKAVKSMTGQPAARTSTGSPPPSGGTATANQQDGGIGDILGGLFQGKLGSVPATANPNANLKDLLPGGLGELLGGAAAGTALSGGLGALIKEFQQGGLGQAAELWIGSGPNQEIASTDLERALGTDTLDALSKQTGVRRDDLLAGLSQHLPDLINQLTPNGRLPTEAEASRMV